MAVAGVRKVKLGGGITEYEFEIEKQTAYDLQIYKAGLELERSLSKEESQEKEKGSSQS